MKRVIPLWIKCPAAVALNQFGRLPLNIVFSNIRWSFTQNRNCSTDVKNRVYHKTQRTLCRYLSRKYGSLIDEICSDGFQGTYVENAPIWVFWWQGLENAPEIIKICIANLQKNAGSHPVHVVDSQNYQEYIQVPDHIAQRLQQKKISITHFSDYVRMKLLAEHGGMWSDATIFAKTPIKEEIFHSPIWTVRNPGLDPVNISGWEWAINFLGGWKGNVLFRSLAEVLERYWLDHSMVADYFLTDCLVRVIYDRCDAVKDFINEVKPSNAAFNYYQKRFHEPLDEQSYELEKISENWLYKVSWKNEYKEQAADGRDTFYGRWKKDFGADSR